MKFKHKRPAVSWLTHSAVCLIPLWISCQARHPLVIKTVGPATSTVSLGRIDPRAEGFLKVFSATETRHRQSPNKYSPHTDYIIYHTDGSVVRRIENSLGHMADAPTLVELPPGRYKIQAQDEEYGLVIVPVVIEPWRTTKVWLDARAVDSFQRLNPSNAVCLPDGRMVGWRAEASEANALQAKH